MATDFVPKVCPACGASVNHQNDYGNRLELGFSCGAGWWTATRNTSRESGWVDTCRHSMIAILKYREALNFYATAMASDIAYDGGAKARVALLPVV